MTLSTFGASGAGRIRALVLGTGVAIVLLLTFAASGNATAGLLYGAQGNNFASDLYTIDPATGAATSVGTIGAAITGLSSDPISGVMYGVTTTNSPVIPLHLVTIDTTTGAYTDIGPLNNGSFDEIIAEIEFDEDGALWGWSESNDNFVSINTSTGAVTDFPGVIGTAGDGMIWDPVNDRLWFMPNNSNGDYYDIDRTTGVPTLAGTLSGYVGTGGRVSSATQSCDGLTGYAMVLSGNSTLATVDHATSTMTAIGTTGVSTMDALAWDCGAHPKSAPVSPAAPLAITKALADKVKRCTPSTGKCRLKINYQLTQAATVTLKITRKYGRKTAAACKKVGRENHNNAVCKIGKPIYTKSLNGVAGANSYTFKFPKSATLGNYKYTLSAKNSTGTAPLVTHNFVLPWG